MSAKQTIHSCLAFFAHAAAAFFGVALVEALISPIVKLFTHSPASIVAREWICSVILAAAIASLLRRHLSASLARWVWVPSLLWFLYGLAGGTSYEIGNQWGTFSGVACAETRGIPCAIFWAFTVPLIRAASYSVAASLPTGDHEPRPVLSHLFAGLFLIGLPKPNNQQAIAEREDSDRHKGNRQ